MTLVSPRALDLIVTIRRARGFRNLVHPHATDFRAADVRRLVGGSFVCSPVGEDPIADEVVSELGQSVFGVRLERALKASMCFAAVAFPPLDHS